MGGENSALPVLIGFGWEQVLLSPVWGLAFKNSVDQHSHVLLPWGQLRGQKEDSYMKGEHP